MKNLLFIVKSLGAFILFLALYSCARLLLNGTSFTLLLLCLLGIYSLYGYFVKMPFSLIGAIIFLILMAVIAVDVQQERHAVNLLTALDMAIGCVAGHLLRKKKFFPAFAAGSTGIAMIVFVRFVYLTALDEITPDGKDITLINRFSSSLTGFDNENPILNEDTVYLVNFTAVYCVPCKAKKKSLELIAQRFRYRPFRLIQIHVHEPREYFTRRLMNGKHSFFYHDNSDSLSAIFASDGVPVEYIFDKSGHAVREVGGFEPESRNNYERRTIRLIEKLMKS